MLDGEAITNVSRDSSDGMWPGYEITFVGRHRKLAPAETFVVTEVDEEKHIAILERSK